MLKFKSILLLSMALFVAACTWVKPTPRSHGIVLVNDSEIVNCVKKGITSSKTLSKILFIPRAKNKVFSELVMLAKNEAAIMGGDAIVPVGTVVGGAQDFIVYRCR